MYEEFFGLSEKPFSIQPDPSFLYWGRSHRLAYAMLEYGVLNHAGISVISGEVGCGKTTLIHRLLDQLSGTHAVALLSNIQAGRGDLLSWVLMGFGQPFAGKTHVELFAQLQEFFISEYSKGRRVILIIDEAQNLSIDMLEELRMLSNINAGKDQLLQLILVGQPQLKDLLNRPDMLQLAQRIGSDFHLTPLSREEIEAYLETRLSIAGARQRIFTEDAVNLIAEQSRGVPRVINIIADTALVYAFSAQEMTVDAETVRNVIRDKFEFGVFGIAAQSDASAPPAPRGEGPSAFVRRPPAGEANTSDRKTQGASAPSLVSSQTAAPRLFEDDEPRMPPPRRRMAPQPGPGLAQGAAGALARKETPPEPTNASENQDLQRHRADDAGATVAPIAHRLHAVPVAPDEPEEPEEQQLALPNVGVVVAGADASIASTIASVGVICPVVFVGQSEDEACASAAIQAGADVLMIADRALSPGRARNAGYRELRKRQPDLDYVQFVETGFILDPNWLETAIRFMDRRPEVAIVEGQVIDAKNGRAIQRVRDHKTSEVQIAGPTALVRASAFEGGGGFRGDLIVNETVDLCVRLRRRGAHVWRLDSVMGVRQGAALGGWWARAVRRGFTFAHGVDLHGAPPEQLFRAERFQAVLWGAIIPLLIIIAGAGAAAGAVFFAPLVGPNLAAGSVLGFGALVYLVKTVATAFRYGPGQAGAWGAAFGETLAHVPEAVGVWLFHFGGARVKAATRGGA